MRKKILVMLTTVSLMCSMMVGNAWAVQSNWNTYYTGPGAAHATDVIKIPYNNVSTHYVQATYISGTNAKVTVSGWNINMRDVTTDMNRTYTFRSSNISSVYSYHAVSRSGVLDSEQYKCASAGLGAYYTRGCVKY